ncbi:TPA: hypothetical protein NV714_001986 [Escherichia coli]|nr:hypothetical protein [Escherichia coli]
MSEIAKKQDIQAVSEDPDDREGSSLRAPLRLEEDLDDVKKYLAGEANIGGNLMPRYGLLSLLLRTTPCFVYGLDSFKKKFGTTAFTDGVHIYICDDFYDKLLKDSKDTKGQDFGIELLILHELMHILFNHNRRLRQYPPDISNIACDLSINTKLQVGYPDLRWAKTLKETGVGFKPGDTERYPKMAEEIIARDLINERNIERQKKKEQEEKNGQKGQQQGQQGQQNNQNGQQQPGQSNGQGQPGQGQGQPGQGNGQGQPSQGKGQPGQGNGQGQQQPGQGSGNGQPDPNGQQGQGNQNGQGNGNGQGKKEKDLPNQNGEFNGENDRHIYDMKDVVEALEAEGLGNVVKALNLPQSGDSEAMEQLQEQADMRKMEAVQRATAQMAQHGSKYPGGHIVESASEFITGMTRGKLSWKMAIRQALFGDGMKFKYNSDELGAPYFVDEIEEIVGVRIPIGQDLPFKPDEAVLAMVDTSGSVQNEDLRAFISEILELKTASQGMGDSASEVIVLSADTVLRGEPIEITDANAAEYMSKGVPLFGRGGTDLAEAVRQASKLDLFKDKKIKSVVYFTDLFDRAPKFAELGLPEGTSVTYVAAPSTTAGSAAYQEEFAKSVEDYAVVVSIREGIEVNLDQAEREAGVDGYTDYSKPKKSKLGI